MNYTQKVAQYIIEGTQREIDIELLELTKLYFLDWLAISMVGSREASTVPVLRLIQQNGGNQQSSIIGTKQKSSLLWAALANGTSAQALDFDDIYAKGPGHFTTPVISSVYPLCEWNGLDGSTLLRAIITGVQVTGAVNDAIMPDHYQRGWHNTSTMGHFGAVAASSMILGLDQEKVCYALGIAASQAAGMQASFGTMTKPLHGGKAAMNGLSSSLLAADGFTGSKEILDKGLLELLSTTVSYEQLWQTLYGRSVIYDLKFKYYACGVATHPAIMSSLRLREEKEFSLEGIKKITARVYPRAYQCAAIPQPITGLQGKFSVNYCIAAALTRGKVGLEAFEDSAVNDPKIQALLPKITLESEPSYQETRSTTIVIDMENNCKLEYTTSPFVEEGDKNKIRKDVIAKYRGIMESYIAKQEIKELEDIILNLEKVNDVSIVAGTLANYLK